jgi:hypothetical protein
MPAPIQQVMLMVRGATAAFIAVFMLPSGITINTTGSRQYMMPGGYVNEE